MYEELYNNEEHEEIKILFEGAQGFGLDIDWGDYPYVTSSHCTVGSAVLNGVPPKCIRDVWGVAKMYETYVGKKKFEGPDPIFETIRHVGEEYGSTTGRDRQVNWMDFDLLARAVDINGVNKVVFNKVDVLDQVKRWCLFSGVDMYEFEKSEDMQYWLQHHLSKKDINVMFSSKKDSI